MNNRIDDQVNKIINILDNTACVEELKEAKVKVQNNQALMNKINAFSGAIEEKQAIFNDEDYKEYASLLNELNYTLLMISGNLKNIINNKECGL